VTSEHAFLKVNRSFGGRRWLARPSDERTALALAQGHGLPELVGRVLSARGIDLTTADAFLNPKLKSLLPDPSHLKDMDAAASRIARAIMEGERVAVFGDYDVDGATSSALLRRFFRAAGSDLTVYIPDRIAEGYGPNAPALLRLQAEGIRLVVTVDCGVTAFDPLAAVADAGLEVVVIDHHAAEPRLPRAIAVVNPNRTDDPSPHKTLAAVGVTFLLVVAVNRVLRNAGWWNDARPVPDLLNWLDMVALGTVCDVVPLVGLNRALVTQGLKIMAKRGNPGITALADLCKLAEKPDAWHAGFILGPRVNAGGRVGASDLGARMLSTDDPREAAELARILDQHNTERRAIEAEVLEEAMTGVEAALEDLGGLVFAVGEGWHPGVIGIVAARLKERYNRAACVVALDNGIGKASGRSVRGVDLGAAVIAARHAGLLIAGGGHPMAAGFSATADRLPELKLFLANRIAAQQVDGPLAPTLELDGMLSVGGATPDLVALLARLGPFGTGNAEPRFALADARIVQASVVGENHVRCILSGQGGERLKAIAFRSLDTDLGKALLKSGSTPMHIAGHLRPDTWQGRNDVQLLIDDAAPVWGTG
jgi:single-stranded-DNA-specific exonuclease